MGSASSVTLDTALAGQLERRLSTVLGGLPKPLPTDNDSLFANMGGPSRPLNLFLLQEMKVGSVGWWCCCLALVGGGGFGLVFFVLEPWNYSNYC